MTTIEREILQALLDLEGAVARMPTANPKPDLMPLFARIDALSNGLPANTDPTLRHYLHKRSYQKARFWLQGREAENAAGNCGHV
jgi:hypothetical protein